MTELIVSGFDDTQTAFLARAALARLQSELPLGTQDVAVVIRSDSGELTVQEALTTAARARTTVSFWQTLADFLFGPRSPTRNLSEALSTELAAAGIDLPSLHRQAGGIAHCDSALFVLPRERSARDRVLGVLHGFRGKTLQVTLKAMPELAVGPSEMDPQSD